MMKVMSEFYDEDDFVPYGPNSISNLRSQFRSENKEYDMTETLQHFEDLQQQNPNFFFDYFFDSENHVEKILWVDSVARKAYAYAYLDCVSFDTTFCTNRFNMPFAPFIGINKHGQTFILGCGFLRDEKESTFKWLFCTSLKFGSFLGRHPGLVEEFNECVDESMTVPEFEVSWA
jgi:hypothetical protein